MVMVILNNIVLSQTEPPYTSALWLKPTEGGIGFYAWLDGKWQILKPMKDNGTPNPYDDEPYDLNGVSATKLADLQDVSLNTVTDGQVLKYNGSTWENGDDNTGTPGPDSVGTEQIIDNSVEMEDLNDSVKSKIQKTYDISDESLSMDFNIQP